MKNERSLPLYELAPTNGMFADKLAKYYGYESATALANSLPIGARIVDIGAGISDFGKVIATARPDVSVTYFDLRYNNAGLLAKAHGENPLPNISFVQGNILDLEQSALKAGSYDRVFSSRLIPHIELEDTKLAREALLNMGELLNSEGEMLVLCRFGPLLRDRVLNRPTAVKITKQELQTDTDRVVDKALSAIRLLDVHRVHQRMKNISATEYFGQAEWRQPDTQGRIHPMRGDIWDPKQHEFVRRMGLRGHIVHAGYVVYAIKDAIKGRNVS